MPWVKGQSGNPKGTPRLDPKVRAAFLALTPRAIVRIRQLMDSEDERVAVQACKVVIDKNVAAVPDLDAADHAKLVDLHEEATVVLERAAEQPALVAGDDLDDA